MSNVRAAHWLILFSGVLGAAGVALAAVAAHVLPDPSLAGAAQFLILHAAAGLALAAASSTTTRPGLFIGLGAVLLAGAGLFAGDIAARSAAGIRLFPMAAPTGGVLMIAGWVGVALAAAAELAAPRR